MNENYLSSVIIASAIEVHKALGPGLLESAYEECLCHESSLRDINFKRQEPVPVKYKGINLDCGYRLDLLVEDLVIVELKAVEKLLPIHKMQVISYLRSTGKKLGLLLNFHEVLLKDGIVRLVNGLEDEQ